MNDKSKTKSKTYIGIALALMLLISALGAALAFTAISDTGEADLGTLAQSLTDDGWVLYTTSTCPACADQKALFGDAVNKLAIVECDTSQVNYDMCMLFNVSVVPTWINEDSRIAMPGLQPIDKLTVIVDDALNEE